LKKLYENIYDKNHYDENQLLFAMVPFYNTIRKEIKKLYFYS